jgi:hypothetical protein
VVTRRFVASSLVWRDAILHIAAFEGAEGRESASARVAVVTSARGSAIKSAEHLERGGSGRLERPFVSDPARTFGHVAVWSRPLP